MVNMKEYSCTFKANECKDKEQSTGKCRWVLQGMNVGGKLHNCGYAKEIVPKATA